MNPADFFSPADKTLITNAVKEAEKNTSGEIRVHIDSKCPEDVLDKAAYLFEKLKMHKTKLRNGVLFYLAVEDKKYAVLGDAGINAKTGPDFWDKTKETMSGYFSKGQFADGLATGITMAGEQLKSYFPYMANDTNELTDDISVGK